MSPGPATPAGNLDFRLRATLGTILGEGEFTDLAPRRGQPAFVPWRLALITILQFREDLSDRPAADAIRARIDGEDLLGLELTVRESDATVLESACRLAHVWGEATQAGGRCARNPLVFQALRAGWTPAGPKSVVTI